MNAMKKGNPFDRICFQYYREMDSIFSGKNNHSPRIWFHRMTMSIYLLYFCRISLFYYFVSFDQNSQFLKLDLLFCLSNEIIRFDHNLVICIAALFLYHFCWYRVINFGLPISAIGNRQPDLKYRYRAKFANVGRLWYELNVDNTNSILRRNRKMFNQLFAFEHFKQNPISYLRNIGSFLRKLFTGTSELNRSKFDQDKLSTLPFVDKQIRIRLFAILMSGEIVFTCYTVVARIMAVINSYAIYKFLTNHYRINWFEFVQIWLDLLLIAFITWMMAKMALITSLFIFSLSFTLASYYRQLNRLVRKIANRFESRQKFMSVLRFFHHEHYRTTGLTYDTSNFVSKLLAVVMITNIPFNVYMMIYMFTNDNKDATEVTVLSQVLLMQYALILFCVVPFAFITEQAHGSSKLMTNLQQRLAGWGHSRPNQITAIKYKHLVLYELINSNSKIVFRGGPIGVITVDSIFQFIFIYVGYLLFVIQMLSQQL